MNKPLVSILIPCYNHEKFLDDCIQSIIAQDYDNIEFLICDDASPDNSFLKIQKYKEKLSARFSNVVIMQNDTNLGVTKNINKMLKLSKGKYIKVLASDDALAVSAIREMEEFLEGNSQVDVVIVNGIKVQEEEHYPAFSHTEKIYDIEPDFSSQGFFERIAHCNSISAPAAMLRRKVFEEYGVYDENIKVEDFEFWLRILKERKIVISFLDRNLIYYRINANSMTSLQENKNLESKRKLFFEAEMQSLYKYREYFEKLDFAEIVLKRILDARSFAISMNLDNFCGELEVMWRQSSLWNDITLKDKISKKVEFFKLSLKKFIRRYFLRGVQK